MDAPWTARLNSSTERPLVRAFCAGAFADGRAALCVTLCYTTPAGLPHSRTIAERCTASGELEATVLGVVAALEALRTPSSVVLGIALAEITRSLRSVRPAGVGESVWARCQTALAAHAIQVHWVPLTAPYAVTLQACIQRAQALTVSAIEP